LNGNTSQQLNRDQGLKKSDVVAGRDPQKNPGLVLSTSSTQITDRLQHESDGIKKYNGIENEAESTSRGSIAIVTKAQFDSHSRSNSSWLMISTIPNEAK
jgi:hypothetical protein